MKQTQSFHSWLLSNFALLLLSLWAVPALTTAQNITPQRGDKITTEDGVFVVSGDNMITNPSFDDGFTDWTAGDGGALSEENFEIVASGGADGGAYLHGLGSAGSGSNKSLKRGWELTPGKTYVFSVWANRPSSGMGNNLQYSRIYTGTSATTTRTEITTLNYTGDTWVQTLIVLTATDAEPFLIANFGWINQSSFDCFFLGEVERSSELVTDRLEAAINEAEQLLATTEEGTAKGQYTAAVRAALSQAISEARSVLQSATTQDQINSAIIALQAAISTYKNSVNPPFELGKQYNIVHSSGFYLTTGGGTVKIANADVEDMTQVFTFVVAPEDAETSGYNLVDAVGNYVYRSGSWDTKSSSSTDLTLPNAIFRIEDHDTYVQLRNMGSGSVLGTDNSTAGSTVYSNKNGTDQRYRWTLKEYVPADQRDAQYNFEELLAKAKSIRDGVSSSSFGVNIFMNSRAAYDAFVDAIATAEAMVPDYEGALKYLQEAIDTYNANKQNKPDPQKPYVVTQRAGGNNLAWRESTTPIVATPDASTSQQFYLEPIGTDGAYAFRNAQQTAYLAKQSSSNWNTVWLETSEDAEAQWTVTALSDGVYAIQNVAGKGYLGSDATVDGSLLYCDKSSTATNSAWFIEEYSPTAALEKVIAKARELAENTPVGSAYYEVPQQAMNELLAAIAAAEATLPTITTFEEGAAAAATLQQAIDKFLASFNPMEEFDLGQTYIVIHSSGNLLTATESGNASITARGEDESATESQIVTLEAVTGEYAGSFTYRLRSVAQETYFARTGDYNTQWKASADSASVVQVVQLDGKYLGLRFAISNTFAGTDATSSGALVYSDKAGQGNQLAYWTLEPYVTVVLDREAFNAAYQKAVETADAMVIGYNVGEYYAEDVAEFRSVISQMRSRANRAKTQDELDAITAELLAQIDVYVARAHTEQIMNRTELNTAITAAEKALASAVAGDADGQYPAEAITAYQQALDAAKAVRDNNMATQDEIDAATEALQKAAADFAAARVHVDMATLKQTILDAKQMLSNAQADRGDGPGKYPESAFTALQAAIDKAQQMVNENKVNQQTVDAEVSALEEAIIAFSNSRTPNDYAALQWLVDRAHQLLAMCDAGDYIYIQEDYDDLVASLAEAEPLLTSTDQDAIDRAVKILRRDIALLEQNMVVGIGGPSFGGIAIGTRDGRIVVENLPAGATVSIFSLAGRQVATDATAMLPRGVYVVRINVGKIITRKVTVR